MKENPSLATVVLEAVCTAVWAGTLWLNAAMGTPSFLLILQAICVVLWLVLTVRQWRRYKNSKDSEQSNEK